jgi:signal transduction histidine kinase
VLLQNQENPDDRFVLLVRAANRFLDETLSPFEVSRLSSMDANAALRRLYDVLEEEAKRIAHVLHDEASQILAVAYLELADIVRESPGPVAERVGVVVKHLDEVREQIRRLSHELRPLILDQLGLVPALSFLANGVRKRSGLEVVVKGDTAGRLSQAIETVLYRTVQEALNNVMRHARATRADVKVWVEKDNIHCVVRDNGVGFEIPEDRKRMHRGLGLTGIHERVGALHGDCKFLSSPGQGTELQVVIPL